MSKRFTPLKGSCCNQEVPGISRDIVGNAGTEVEANLMKVLDTLRVSSERKISYLPARWKKENTQCHRSSECLEIFRHGKVH